MRYRKENGQWKEVTPIGVSREEFDEVKQDLTHFVGGDAWTQRTYNEGEVCIHNNIAWKCLATTTVEPSASATTYWKQISLKELSNNINDLIKLVPAEVSYQTTVSSNVINVSLNGYTPIAIAYAMTNNNACAVIGTRLFDDSIDLRFSSSSSVILRYGILYKKK